MELIKDYDFRKLVSLYLKTMFTFGMDRSLTHDALCNYLVDNWSIYKGLVNGEDDSGIARVRLHLLIATFITDDIFDSLGYPKNDLKTLIDNFCTVLDKLKPVVENDLKHFLYDEPFEYPRLSLSSKYTNLDEYLKNKNK